MKYTSVHISQIEQSNRYEPEYWILADVLNDILQRYPHRSLDECAISIKKGIFDMPAKKYQTSGIPFLRISNLKYCDLDKTGMVYISNTDNNRNKKTQLFEGDIAFSKIGTLGKMLRISNEFPCVNLSQNLIGVRLKDDVDKNYIFAFLLSRLALYQINKNRKQQLQDKLNLNDLKDIQICDVDNNTKIDIHTKIAEICTCISQADVLLQQARNIFLTKLDLESEKEKKFCYFTAKLSNFKDANLWTPQYSKPLYVDTLAHIKNRFDTINLGEIVDIIKGDEVGSDSYIEYLDKRPTDVPFVRTSDIVNYEIDQYPDFYVPYEDYCELSQDVRAGDVLFTNDGKIGLVGMVTDNDKLVLQSHIRCLRLNEKGEKYGLTQEYLFTALSIKEIGIYQSKRYTVIQSTIPTLSGHLKDFIIPILDDTTIQQITSLVKAAFELKDKKKQLMKAVREEMDNIFQI